MNGKRRIMYIMYSLLCCSTGKHIHNIDKTIFGLWFVCCVVAQANVYIIEIIFWAWGCVFVVPWHRQTYT